MNLYKGSNLLVCCKSFVVLGGTKYKCKTKGRAFAAGTDTRECFMVNESVKRNAAECRMMPYIEWHSRLRRSYDARIK